LLGKFVKSTALATPSDRKLRSDPWIDDADEAGKDATEPLTREQAQVLLANSSHAVSPWRVVAAQAAIGVLAATVAGLFGAAEGWFWSALYGAAVVVVPGALMARGMTSRQSSLSPGASAASVMLWSMVKMGVSIVMLMLAARLVQPLSWPALLATMVLCMLTYWFALLLKRGR
jgi:ATP synthase protein I